ncbi:translation initiation factor IF-2 subunit beta [Candidatus Woesearchaeota archaeon]|nr:translation initiation factor IF-2 subunit beta [Candidatus Woesearchaeota archaeon]
MDYEALLAKAREALPENINSGERFEIPKIKGHLQGNKTIISNFGQIATTTGRKVELLVKYIEKQLATKAVIKDNFVIFNTKLSASKINERVQQFVDQFVICKECGKPDTKLSKDSGIFFVRCSACGAKYSINSKL